MEESITISEFVKNDKNQPNESELENKNSIKLENLIKIQIDFHQFIKKYDHNADKIFNDKKASRTIYLILNNVYCANNNKLALINLNFEYEYAKTVCNLLDYILPKIVHSIKNENETADENQESTEKKKIMTLAKHLINTLRSYSNYSVKFCHNFHESNGIRVLTKYICQDDLLDYYIRSFKPNEQKSINTIVRGSMGAFLNLSRVYDNFMYQYESENCVEKILKFSEKLKDLADNRVSAYITLASICTDEEINQFSDLKHVIPEIVNLISKCSNAIKSKKNLSRCNVQLDEDKDEVHQVCKIEVKGTIWNLIELLNALYHMSVNDTIKYDIYFTYKMNQIIRDIFNHGNEIEIEYSLKLLYQLCFDKRIAQDIQNDTSMKFKLKEITQKTETKISVNKICSGMLWVIDNDSNIKQKSDLNNLKVDFLSTRYEKKHIMISYNRESRDICVLIKKKLEEINLKVWMDISDIHGSSLESMANAIEDSLCVIICMTEKYKQSSNCRAEAEYSFKLNKSIIPIIMQSNYKPNGWLGIILGSKIFVDFTKYEFEECMRRLKQEILQLNEIQNNDLNHNQNDNKNSKQSSEENGQIINLKTIEDWLEQQVDYWLNEKKIHSVIIENIRPCDGKILTQLYLMLQNAPEFFYTSISYSSNSKLATREVALFAYELKSLFTSKK